ncbi:MAG TPA: tetratricopeptide repeat protein [Rhizomicrobium sp.]|nr:tetratricopeptide repeat protein [Rhizomicrobium sp.]
MSRFDDLPRRDRSHTIEEEAIIAFQRRLSESRVFILQGEDRKDYGTDCQIEVIDDGRATNVRVQVQLKGTERALNADGSLSVEVSRSNLNYLLMQRYSFYACYHIPTGSLRICPVDNVLRQYEHGGKTWTEQQSLTVSFVDELTIGRLVQLAALAQSQARSSRDSRIGQSGTRPEDLPRRVLGTVPDVHVPEDPVRAGQILTELYEHDADDVISAGFDKFAAALGASSDAMGPCYMAEINLGMASMSQHPRRIEEAIGYFRSKLDGGRYQAGSLHYTIGNAFSALGDEQSAKLAYEAALTDPAFVDSPDLAAQCHKNLGTSFERLGEQVKAVEHYLEALRLNPNLAEAHNAMGNHYVHIGQYEDALVHFDRVVFAERTQGKTSAVAGWRANVLFNLGDGRAAFREINSLLGRADSLYWVWPWCARLVASFGRTTTGNAVQAVDFWQRYVRAHPSHTAGRRELLLTTFYLRSVGENLGRSYAEFRDEFDRHIAHVDANDAALPWDRLGHWAQDEGDWAEAERCFRKAYDLEGGHYGYCLGTALNFLGRYEESLPLLLRQAQFHQPDAMSWFQVASAYANLKRAPEAIDAYHKALALNPDYALAMFDLGGTYWNSGDIEHASQVWKAAINRFPGHELAAKVKRDFPHLL